MYTLNSANCTLKCDLIRLKLGFNLRTFRPPAKRPSLDTFIDVYTSHVGPAPSRGTEWSHSPI